MKKWKLPVFCLMIVACLALNYGGRRLAGTLNLPFWLDSFGTILCGYMAGPAVGGLVGLTSNMVFHIVLGAKWEYGLISLMIGVISGVAAQRKKMGTLFDTLTVGGVIALVAMVLSVPLNYFLNRGSTGNPWGDAVIGFFQERDFPEVPCLILGQMYMEVLDKIVLMILAYLVIRLTRRHHFRSEAAETAAVQEAGGEEAQEETQNEDGKGGVKALALLTAAGLAMGAAGAARGEEAAQNISRTNYVQTIYSSHNGLPCGKANDIAQTKDGILWIATYAGLYRYNGREFRWMDGFESVRNANALYVDEEGRLWIGTNDNGVSIVINEKVVNVIDRDSGLPNNSVTSIIRSTDGYYYIGTRGSMQVLSLNYGLRKLNTLSEIQSAVSLAADGENRVAAVSEGGTLYLMRGGRILSSRQMTDDSSKFKSCEFDQDGRLLAATDKNQIFIFDISDDWFREAGVPLVTGDLAGIKDMDCLEDGELIITTDQGIGVFDAERVFHRLATGDFKNNIDKALVDYQGNLWFTSSRLGLLRMAPSDFRDIYGTADLENHVVNAIAKWQDPSRENEVLYYFGTDEGLDAVDRDGQKAENYLTEQLDNARIRSMMVDAGGNLWICNYKNYLLEVEPGENGEQHRYTESQSNGITDNNVRVVTQLADGTVVAGGDIGLNFIRDHKVVQKIQHSRVQTIVELPDGRLLAGTDGNGLLILEKTVNESGAEAWEIRDALTREDGLSSEVILRIIPDPGAEGAVFVVTSNGLCYMDPAGKTRLLNNFPYYNNYDIWIRADNPEQNLYTLFILSSAGVYVADRTEVLENGKDNSYELLDTRRGLNSSLTPNAWTYYDEDTDELYIACDTGAFTINTRRLSGGAQVYRMSVPIVRMDGTTRQVERSETLKIERGVSKLELFPEVVNYTIQDPYVGYQLEGFDTDWNIVPQDSLTSITYTNLPAGEYTFRLGVFSNDQKTILAERRYRMEKEKELYDSPWFIGYLLTIPMFTVGWVTWMLVKRRNQRIERELAEANRQVEMGKQTVGAIANAVDAKDERTGGHSKRVSQYSKQIAEAYGLDRKQCQEIEWAARLHDIGKIAIRDDILNKDTRLTDEEYAIMKSHTTEGAKILSDFTMVDHVAEGALYHHERPDGRGYPQGLKGDEIPLFAKIIGVADAFDAMTAARVYRKQMDFGYVLGELEKGRGTQFAPEFVDILLNLIRTNQIDLNELYGITPEEAGLTEAKPEAPDQGKEA